MRASNTLPFLCSKKGTRQAKRDAGDSYFRPFTVLLLITLLIACGSNDGDGGDAGVADTSQVEANTRILDRDVTLSGDDIISLGLKSGKKYDVADLPGAVDNRVFFWRINDIPVQYEARFYESHAAATEFGPAPAEEGSGEDAILDADDAVYKEGVRDRRTVFDFRGTPRPRYGTYAIYANMVVLCEGRDDAEAWERCTALIEALDNR